MLARAQEREIDEMVRDLRAKPVAYDMNTPRAQSSNLFGIDMQSWKKEFDPMVVPQSDQNQAPHMKAFELQSMGFASSVSGLVAFTWSNTTLPKHAEQGNCRVHT